MLCAHPPGRAMISEGRAAQARWIFLGRTFLWCVKTPPLFYVVKGVPPLSPTSFGVLPLFPPKKERKRVLSKRVRVFTRQLDGSLIPRRVYELVL